MGGKMNLSTTYKLISADGNALPADSPRSFAMMDSLH
jgi:hypothetical protein